MVAKTKYEKDSSNRYQAMNWKPSSYYLRTRNIKWGQVESDSCHRLILHNFLKIVKIIFRVFKAIYDYMNIILKRIVRNWKIHSSDTYSFNCVMISHFSRQGYIRRSLLITLSSLRDFSRYGSIHWLSVVKSNSF